MGDAAQVGRVVCDATWHHFVNINLNGSGAGLDPMNGLPRTGLYAFGIPTPEYLKIQRYYLNTARSPLVLAILAGSTGAVRLRNG
jgi:hypothetical protein